MFFEANLAFLRDGHEQSWNIVYEADTPKEAIDGAYRWARDRRKSVPDVFGILLCVKVSEYPIGRILPDGSLRTGMAGPFHEWKIDHPGGALMNAADDRPHKEE